MALLKILDVDFPIAVEFAARTAAGGRNNENIQELTKYQNKPQEIIDLELDEAIENMLGNLYLKPLKIKEEGEFIQKEIQELESEIGDISQIDSAKVMQEEPQKRM